MAHRVSRSAGTLRNMVRSVCGAAIYAGEFPVPPIPASPALQPIRRWSDMEAEARVTGVQFDAFWDACVGDEIAYFFRWLGRTRATVLVVFEADGPIFIEVRQAPDVEVAGRDAEPVLDEVLRLFHGRFAPPPGPWMH
jgi:hypothetical protein